jgi:putative heme-binding domain-containing protein
MFLLLCLQAAWADPKLPVREGLEAWYDVGRQVDARRALGKPAPAGPIDVLYDASGRERHAAAPDEAARPLWMDGRLRFDGLRQHLLAAWGRGSANELTIFVVAAPFSNRGGFRAFLALHGEGANDFQSGLTLDQGPAGSERFDTLNAEGAGFGGARDLLNDATDFGVLARFRVEVGAARVALAGQASRERSGPPLALHALSLGARRFAFGAPPVSTGFLDGELAEVLIYGRALGAAEAEAVDAYLAQKHGTGRRIPLPRLPEGARRLVRAADPPPVKVLEPGWSVRELPLALNNINNVLYRPDGALVALAYDGDLHLLRDTDGDGLEDKAELFWDNRGRLRAPIGMALHPRGVVVPSKGKVSLIAEGGVETVLASGWTELPHGVDALGAAVAADGSVYFGLGCANFTAPYANYRLDGERGTILKITPQGREIVATGIRFPVALRFDAAGELFATDQEGATWLPNGNPFDELLHIRKGRHYGFPPRHPKHLPDVIDEPSVFDYAPQHQSTCGFAFGPDGDAFVTAYSRGKIFRTTLVKSAVGYVARSRVFALLTSMPVDVCFAPDGQLLVAAHGGGPDWGSGPSGKGRLFKLKAEDVARPVLAWPQGPREIRVAFDRPVEPARARTADVEYGAHVDAGDRWESIRPGYQVVGDQLAEPRFGLPLLSAQLSSDRRTLLLPSAPHPLAAGYALTLPDAELRYDLHGVEASWEGDVRWSGWLPHADLEVARALTKGSAAHDELWALLARPGTLTLRMKVDLRDILRPAVQPGARLDHAWPAERATLTFSGGTSKELTTSSAEPLPVEISLRTPGELRVHVHTAEDARPRALPLRRFLLPWASTTRERPKGPREIPEIAGGRWSAGRELFFGETAGCGKCHKARGRGGEIGPDLSNLPMRDYASVLRDIERPSFAIHPDYAAQVFALEDGRVLSGVARARGDELLLADSQGRLTSFPKASVRRARPSEISIMPEGLAQGLGPEKMRDLLAFLLEEDPRLHDYGAQSPPPPRSRDELRAVLAGSVEAPRRPLRVLLVDGPKDHGPGEHDYPAWRRAWTTLLARAPDLRVEGVTWASADVVVLYQRGSWDAERAKEVDALLARGGGLVLAHYAVDGGKDPAGMAKRIGLAWQGGRSKFRHGALELSFAPHPITRNFTKAVFHDESYWNLMGDVKDVEVLASGVEEGEPRPLLWAKESGGGRVFVSILGHFSWTFDDPLFRALLLRGIAWSAKEPADRFNELIEPGARLGE